MSRLKELFSILIEAAENPMSYAERWKDEKGRKVIGIFPMNFPRELIHATGALPVLIQEDREAITLGRTLLHEFYCGYTRSIVDQAATNKFDIFDGFFVVDHCVALLGAVDALRFQMPEKKVYLGQYPASMDEDTTHVQVERRNMALIRELENLCRVEITTEGLSKSVKRYNESKAFIRNLYELRRQGKLYITASEMQAIITSSMVMDVDEHTEVMQKLFPLLKTRNAPPGDLVKLHLSGHLCHAPRPELLELIEENGAVIVDDDLFAGYRYVSTDVSDQGDPLKALVTWYMERNSNVPCCTRAQKDVDWADYLVDRVEKNGADGVITLLPKFCEPHMLYFPEIKKALESNKIPHLRLETEHEGIPIESIRTRLESFFEMIRRSRIA